MPTCSSSSSEKKQSCHEGTKHTSFVPDETPLSCEGLLALLSSPCRTPSGAPTNNGGTSSPSSLLLLDVRPGDVFNGWGYDEVSSAIEAASPPSPRKEVFFRSYGPCFTDVGGSLEGALNLPLTTIQLLQREEASCTSSTITGVTKKKIIRRVVQAHSGSHGGAFNRIVLFGMEALSSKQVSVVANVFTEFHPLAINEEEHDIPISFCPQTLRSIVNTSCASPTFGGPVPTRPAVPGFRELIPVALAQYLLDDRRQQQTDHSHDPAEWRFFKCLWSGDGVSCCKKSEQEPIPPASPANNNATSDSASSPSPRCVPRTPLHPFPDGSHQQQDEHGPPTVPIRGTTSVEPSVLQATRSSCGAVDCIDTDELEIVVKGTYTLAPLCAPPLDNLEDEQRRWRRDCRSFLERHDLWSAERALDVEDAARRQTPLVLFSEVFVAENGHMFLNPVSELAVFRVAVILQQMGFEQVWVVNGSLLPPAASISLPEKSVATTAAAATHEQHHRAATHNGINPLPIGESIFATLQHVEAFATTAKDRRNINNSNNSAGTPLSLSWVDTLVDIRSKKEHLGLLSGYQYNAAMGCVPGSVLPGGWICEDEDEDGSNTCRSTSATAEATSSACSAVRLKPPTGSQYSMAAFRNVELLSTAQNYSLLREQHSLLEVLSNRMVNASPWEVLFAPAVGEKNIMEKKRTVVGFYCGSGWRAAEALFYAQRLRPLPPPSRDGGYHFVLYSGGWHEWAAAHPEDRH